MTATTAFHCDLCGSETGPNEAWGVTAKKAGENYWPELSLATNTPQFIRAEKHFCHECVTQLLRALKIADDDQSNNRPPLITVCGPPRPNPML